MHKIKKVLTGVAALAALAAGGTTIANATGTPAAKPAASQDENVTGSAASRAGSAATSAVGGGKVTSVERSDDGGTAVYEVKVDKDGEITEVGLDKRYSVTSQKADDDQAGEQDKRDGDGETADD